MDKNNTSNIGEEIKERIQQALTSDNFKKLNENIGKTVNQALEEARKNSSHWQQKKKSKREKELNKIPYSDYETVENTKNAQAEVKPDQNKVVSQNNYKVKKDDLLISKAPAGRVSGILLMIFGNIGIGLTVILILAAILIASLTADILSALGYFSLILGPLFIGFALMVGKGSSLRKRYKRFKQYVQELNNQSFIAIDKLAKSVNRNRKFVIKDLRKMISTAMFPKAKLDAAETILFLNDASYQAHLKLLKGLRLQEEEKEKQLKERQEKEMASPQEKAVLDVISEGKTTIQAINAANAKIKGQLISSKLLRLEVVITKIFQYIESNPDEVLEIRKFMDYYLPTTLKLVTVYQDLEAEPFQGPTIKKTKKEIEETLDTINYAFENLLDGFYEDTAMDIASDISVLNTLLAQEGLTKRDFEQGEKNG